jgi:hypothetical protein
MKITKTQLRKIIQEELQATLNENPAGDVFGAIKNKYDSFKAQRQQQSEDRQTEKKVEEWWYDKFKMSNASLSRSLARYYAKIKAGNVGQGEVDDPHTSWSEGRARSRALRNNQAPVLESDIYIGSGDQGKNVFLRDVNQTPFLEVTGEDWLPAWVSEDADLQPEEDKPLTLPVATSKSAWKKKVELGLGS